MRTPSLVLTGMLVGLVPCLAFADWPCTTKTNLPVCTAVGDQYLPVVASDGAGGVFVVWEDMRGGDYDLYAQHIDAAGELLWTADGVPVCTAASEQRSPAVAADGAGGVWIAWRDYRSGDYDIYGQRLDAAGVPYWAADGKRLCGASAGQIDPVVVGDGSGGAIVAWGDGRNGDADLYIQRFDADGAPLWGTSDGVAVSTASGQQLDYRLANDASGGVFVTWRDRQAEGGQNYVRIQRYDGTGSALWGGGIAVSSTEGQTFPTIVSDSAGAIVAWQEDSRTGAVDEYGQTTYDLYAQRFDFSGAAQWIADGVPLVTEPSYQNFPRAVTDGAGGAIVCWEDRRGHHAAISNVYAQRVLASGTTAWSTDGIAVSPQFANQYTPLIVDDLAGGAIVSWFDGRNVANGFDIYAQRLSATGELQWTAEAAPICLAPGHQFGAVLVSDGGAGAFIAWYDQRSGAYDIYAHRVAPNACDVPLSVPGSLTARLPELAAVRPNPMRDGGEIVLRSPDPIRARVVIVDASGRRVRDLVNGVVPAGDASFRWDGRDAAGHPVRSGLYLVRAEVGGRVFGRRFVVTR